MKIKDLLPILPDLEEIEECCKEIGSNFRFNSILRSFDIDRYSYRFVVNYDNKVEVYQRNNFRLFDRFIREDVHAVKICLDKLFIQYREHVEVIFLSQKTFTDNQNKFMTIENNNLIIRHRNKIKNISISDDGELISIITGKLIFIHHIKNAASQNPKLKTEFPLFSKIANNKLYFTSVNGFYTYDISTKSYTQQITGIMTYPQFFTVKDDISIISDKENRLNIIYKNNVVRVMEQNKRIKEIVHHENKDFFAIVFVDEIVIYYGKMKEEYECRIVERIKGDYKDIKFRNDLNWIYGRCGKNVVLFI